MEKINIPIKFFVALAGCPPIYRLLWFDWLANKSDLIFNPNFCENLSYNNVEKDKIRDCYAIGIEILQEGNIPLETDKFKKRKVEASTDVKEIIQYLNLKANTNYRLNSDSTTNLIMARMAEGFKKEDFFKVIDNKVEQWLGTEHQQYLRPITLFNKSKFEAYLNQPQHGKKQPNSSIQQIRNTINEAKSRLFE